MSTVHPPFLQSIRLDNLLSFGEDSFERAGFEFDKLNILIGANGTGKSNLIDAIDLLRSAPDISEGYRKAIRLGGSMKEWMWKGAPDAIGILDAVLHHPNRSDTALRHTLEVSKSSGAFQLLNESIENSVVTTGYDQPYVYYNYQRGRPVINEQHEHNGYARRDLKRENVESNTSILSQYRDPERYPELTYLAEQYDKVKIYRDWTFGRKAPLRQGTPIETRDDRLEEDFSNLGRFISRMIATDPRMKRRFLEALKEVYSDITDVTVAVGNHTADLYIIEREEWAIQASRLSDGTLRYLSILAILLDPTPPPLICLEEPELGLHSDVHLKLAELLIDASQRTQLVVTTHSHSLIDALSEHPEYVITVEKREGQSYLQRLERQTLEVWLEEQGLGQLWMEGHLGAKRW